MAKNTLKGHLAKTKFKCFDSVRITIENETAIGEIKAIDYDDNQPIYLVDAPGFDIHRTEDESRQLWVNEFELSAV